MWLYQYYYIFYFVLCLFVCIVLPVEVNKVVHFAWGVAEAKCILITRVCVSVCVSVPCRIPTLLHGPGCTLGNGRGFLLVMHYWAYLQSVHGFRCYDNIAPNAKCQRVLVLAVCLVIIFPVSKVKHQPPLSGSLTKMTNLPALSTCTVKAKFHYASQFGAGSKLFCAWDPKSDCSELPPPVQFSSCNVNVFNTSRPSSGLL